MSPEECGDELPEERVCDECAYDLAYGDGFDFGDTVDYTGDDDELFETVEITPDVSEAVHAIDRVMFHFGLLLIFLDVVTQLSSENPPSWAKAVETAMRRFRGSASPEEKGQEKKNEK